MKNRSIVFAVEGAAMEDRWLSVDEIATHLGIKRDTVYRWIDRFGMPAHRMGRLWKFKKDDVDEWVKAGGASALENYPRRRK
jgi:excisionase family DNA binding protein